MLQKKDERGKVKLHKIMLTNYRNIAKMEINAHEKINILYGDNAQGKTNIIEAIWLLSGNNSFRGSHLNELIMFEQQFLKIDAAFSNEMREQKIEIAMQTNGGAVSKKIKLNGVESQHLSCLNGTFFCVVFSPSHLSLVTDGPKNRRKFLDIAISQIKPQYKEYMKTYDKILTQRNALLKSDCGRESFFVWDDQIAKVGTIISILRQDYIKKILPLCREFYSGISKNIEQISLLYQSTVFEDIGSLITYDEKAIAQYKKALTESFDMDKKNRSTTCGIHRDDLDIFINSIPVKTFGSQGQQRSCVITLKLAEAGLLKKIMRENPVMLLDDVMSELDEKRQDYILNHLSGMQVFITCCDISSVKKLKDGQVFNIDRGKLVE